MSARGVYVVTTALLSAYIGWEWGEILRGNETVVSSIIDAFAILAGVLMAVILIIGDPSMLLPGNWRVGFEHAQEIQNRIARFAHLFTIYLLTFCLALIALLLNEARIDGGDWVFVLLLGMASWGVLLSIPLPYSLMSIQKERMKEEVKRRKAAFPEIR